MSTDEVVQIQFKPLSPYVSNQSQSQSVEHCNGIAEVMGSNPVQAWIFFRL